ncbi:aspartyl-phosphate phosphatase Spo0E family protein [Bacillus sp. MUM 13]|uniref:aspartyl-phosphate phosphatase Spo0E family protein n=1 Tax=Bacillus sp. MUM 13 TaxID=1678001 RepID=UPI0009F42692|nr:aspartyl-phosphate phosphatase Spo0E family protein [Bacillus sp. MUM 13]
MTVLLLTEMIKTHRGKMIEAGLKYGLSSPVTVRKSQELDYLLNLNTNISKWNKHISN